MVCKAGSQAAKKRRIMSIVALTPMCYYPTVVVFKRFCGLRVDFDVGRVVFPRWVEFADLFVVFDEAFDFAFC